MILGANGFLPWWLIAMDPIPRRRAGAFPDTPMLVRFGLQPHDRRLLHTVADSMRPAVCSFSSGKQQVAPSINPTYSACFPCSVASPSPWLKCDARRGRWLSLPQVSIPCPSYAAIHTLVRRPAKPHHHAGRHPGPGTADTSHTARPDPARRVGGVQTAEGNCRRVASASDHESTRERSPDAPPASAPPLTTFSWLAPYTSKRVPLPACAFFVLKESGPRSSDMPV